MTCLPLKQAAKALAVSVSTLRRLIARGAPVVRRGRRGRGGAALIDPAAVAAWKAAQGPSLDEARAVVAMELASVLPAILADSIEQSFIRVEGPDKKRVAGYLAGAWYLCACKILDKLREVEPSIPEVRELPEQIERLRKISAQ